MFSRLQHADQRDERDRAGDGAEVVAATAEDRYAADHGRGDRLEEVRVAHAERRLTAVGDEDDARERGEQAAQHVQRDGHEPDVDPGEERRRCVVADRVDAPAERRRAEQEGDEDVHPSQRRRSAGHAERRSPRTTSWTALGA